MLLKYRSLVIWVFCFAVLLGSSYNLYLSYEYEDNVDCQTYLQVANGNFKDQNLIRRYRFIVPFAAKAIALPIEKIYHKLWPNRAKNDHGPIRIGFLVVNLMLMSLVGMFIYYLLKAYHLSSITALLVSIIVLIGGRWGTLFSAAPLTDSLYMLLITMLLYAIKTDKYQYLIISLLIGTIAKEAFLMLIPLALYFSNYSKPKLLFCIGIGIGITWWSRYLIDLSDLQISMSKSIEADIHHIENITRTIKRLAGVRGIGELCTVFGLFTLIFATGFWGGKSEIKVWFGKVDSVIWAFFPIIIAHVLLSTEAARMIYLFAAPLAVIMGLIIENHYLFSFYQKNIETSLND